MDRVRIIALDMDGTLLASDHNSIPQENIDAIREADKKGVHVVINTGRMVEDASDFICRYNLPCMIIAANGARACSGPMPESKWLYRCAIDSQDAHRILDVLLPTGLMINGFEDGVVHSAGGKKGDEYHLVKRGLIRAEYGEASIRQAADRGLMKIFVIGDGFAGDLYDSRIEPARQSISAISDHLKITSSAPGNIEITSSRAGKGTTLAQIAKELGMSAENVMAVGDAGNDLDMLNYAYHSVAMGNASSEIQAVCRYITDTNDRCGVAKIIRRVLESQREKMSKKGRLFDKKLTR